MTSSLPAAVLEALIDAARSARERAYAPYSEYLVGAALHTPSGRIFSGCNVENASYGVTLCAERVAVTSMVAAGERELDAIVVFTDKGPLGMPCGVCRQTLVEFAGPECSVVVVSPREQRITSLAQLLPEPFTLRK